jgi:hypothetical protein
VTSTGPVVAPTGTVQVITLSDHEETVAVVPLKDTVAVLWESPKFFPLMVTVVPIFPEAGLSRPWLHHPTNIPPYILSDSSQKNPYQHAEDRGLVFEVFPSADRPPASLRTRDSAPPCRHGFALIGKILSLLLKITEQYLK